VEGLKLTQTCFLSAERCLAPSWANTGV